MKKFLTALLGLTMLTFVSAQTMLYQGGTGLATSTAGDLIVGTSSKFRYSRLPIGGAGTVLQASSTSPTNMNWVATSSLFSIAGLTSGRVVFATTSGLLSDDAGLTYNNSTNVLASDGYTFGASGSAANTGTGFFQTGIGTIGVATGGASNITLNGNNAAGITLGDASYISWTTDPLKLTRQGTKQLMISGDGVGSSTNAGWVLGYFGTSAQSGIWSSTVAPGTTNHTLFSDGGNTYLNAAAGGLVGISVNGGVKWAVNGNGGSGPSITAGIATTDLNALSVTQTWNGAGVTFTGHKFVITDTASAVGSLAMQILGGAAGTTNLFKVSNIGNLTVGNGTTLIPALAGADSASTGILFSGNSVGITSNGASVVDVSGGNLFRITNTIALGWGAGAANAGALDTAISRVSSGVIGVGTGAAGSVAGQLRANSIHASSSILGFASSTALTAPSLFFTDATGTGNFSVTGQSTLAMASTTGFTSSLNSFFATSTITGDLSVSGNFIPRVKGYATNASTTINIATTDVATTTVNASTTFVNPSGTAIDRQMFEISILATTTVGVYWGTNFASSTDLQLPSTVASGTTIILFQYSPNSGKWNLLGLLKTFFQ